MARLPTLYIRDASLQEARLNSPTYRRLTLKARLGTRHVSIEADLKTQPGQKTEQLVHELFFATLAHELNLQGTFRSPTEEKPLTEKEQPLAKFFRPGKELLAQRGQNPSQGIVNLRSYFQKREINELSTSDLIESLSIKMRPLNIFERVLLKLYKIWQGFIQGIGNLFNLNTEQPQESDLDNLDEYLFDNERNANDGHVSLFDNLERLAGTAPGTIVKEREDVVSPESAIVREVTEQILPVSLKVESSVIKDPSFKALYVAFTAIAENALKALFEDERAPLSSQTLYKQKLDEFKTLLSSSSEKYNSAVPAMQQFIPHLLGILKTTISLFVVIPDEEGKLKENVQGLLTRIFPQLPNSVELIAQLKTYLESLTGDRKADPDVIEFILALIQNPKLPITLEAAQKEQLQKAMVEAISWQLGRSFKSLVDNVNVIFKQIHDVTNILNSFSESDLKEAVSTTTQALGKQISERLGHRLIALLEKVDYTALLDQIVTKAHTRAGNIQTAQQKVRTKQSGWEALGETPEFLGEAIKQNFPPTPLTNQDLEKILLKVTEELMVTILSADEMKELCQESLEVFKNILLKNILSKESIKEEDKPKIGEAISVITEQLKEIFRLTSLPTDLQIKLPSGIKTFLADYIRPMIEKAIKDNIAKSLLEKFSNPTYLNHLCAEKIFPLLNDLFIEQSISSMLCTGKYQAELIALAEEEETSTAIDDLQTKLETAVFELLPDDLITNQTIKEESKKVIKEFVERLKAELQKRQANDPELVIDKELITAILSETHEATTASAVETDVYWDFLSRFIFGIGGLMEGTWVRSILETEYVSTKIASTVSDSCNPLRSSHKMIIDSTAASLQSLDGEMGDIMFGDPVDLVAMSEAIAINMDSQTKLAAHLIHNVIAQNLNWIARKGMPAPSELHHTLKDALKTFFCSKELNQSFFLQLFELLGTELKKAAHAVEIAHRDFRLVEEVIVTDADDNVDDGAGVYGGSHPVYV